MGLRRRFKRLKRRAQQGYITIPQRDRPPARFPQRAAAEALVNMMNRREAGDNAPPEHPLCQAARNSSDPWWSSSFYTEYVDPYVVLEDLSE